MNRNIHMPGICKEENDIINKCTSNCTDETEKIKITFLILYRIHGLYRSRKDIVNIMCEYPGLDNKDKLENCVNSCIEEGFLVKIASDENGDPIFGQDNDCIRKFYALESISDHQDAIQQRIKNVASNKNYECIGLLSGQDNNGKAYLSFINRLRTAQKEIWLPMINTYPHPETISVLKERAMNNVKIYIFMADYKRVTSKKRPSKEDHFKKWREELQGYKNIKMRKYTNKEYMQFGSCVLIDDHILRLVIFDPEEQKSTEGFLFEFDDTKDLNIISLFSRELSDAWNKSSRFYKTLLIWSVLPLILLLAFVLIVLQILEQNQVEPTTQNLLRQLFMGIIVSYILQLVTLFVRKFWKFISHRYFI